MFYWTVRSDCMIWVESHSRLLFKGAMFGSTKTCPNNWESMFWWSNRIIFDKSVGVHTFWIETVKEDGSKLFEVPTVCCKKRKFFDENFHWKQQKRFSSIVSNYKKDDPVGV
jgi:hypothetical protein